MAADPTITAASVAATANTVTATGVAGATIVAGNAVYADSTASGVIKPCTALGVPASLLLANCVGVALHGALAGQPIVYAISGNVTMPTLIAGTGYFLSTTTSGGYSDGTALEATIGTVYATFVGMAISTSVMKLAITPTQVPNT